MADLNNLNQITLIPNMPAFYPSFYPAAPAKAETFQVYQSRAEQLGVTTLDTYSAPGVPVVSSAIGHSRAIAGNGNVVLAGNAPYQGIYTGIQQE